MEDIKLHPIVAFDNYEVKQVENGHVIVTTEIVDSALNYYGNAHGGYLFTLCDQISGLVARATGFDAVTLQSSINYLKAGHLGDMLTIEGTCVHNGRSTKVVDVTVTNAAGVMLCKGSFTMYVTGERQTQA